MPELAGLALQAGDGEKIIFRTKRYFVLYQYILIGLISGAGAVWMTVAVSSTPSGRDVGWMIVLLWVILAVWYPLGIFYDWFVVNSTDYVVTSHRVIFTEGVFSKHQEVLPRDRIQDVHIRQWPVSSFFGYGDVFIETAGAASARTLLRIRDPRAFRDAIGTAQVSHSFTAHTTPADSISQLERLHALRDKGAITDAEYEREKDKLLG